MVLKMYQKSDANNPFVRNYKINIEQDHRMDS